MDILDNSYNTGRILYEPIIENWIVDVLEILVRPHTVFCAINAVNNASFIKKLFR